ncbi:hypothetical protein AVEN_1506-1 [Araneus ventricosus]|uniref:Uncharacterized protein n=1 Tax=Araneus ventricosus TaxID=182803 RepID=A0A4Y2GEA4_ARAVE|nr:hypothetical protein AVEN_1506-1 [Araneus ventricosus]
MCSQREWFEELKPSSNCVLCSQINLLGSRRTPNIENQEDISDLGKKKKRNDIKLEETERAIDDKYSEFRRSQRERKPPVRYPFNEAFICNK